MLLLSIRTFIALLCGALLLLSEESLTVPVRENTTVVSTSDPEATAAAEATLLPTTANTEQAPDTDPSNNGTAAAEEAAAGSPSPDAPLPVITAGGEAWPSTTTQPGNHSPVAPLAGGTSVPPGTSASPPAQTTASLLPPSAPPSTTQSRVSSASSSSSTSSYSQNSSSSFISSSFSSAPSTSSGSNRPPDETSTAHPASTTGRGPAAQLTSQRSPSLPPALFVTTASSTSPGGVWALPYHLTEFTSNPTSEPKDTALAKDTGSCSTRAIATTCLTAIAILAAVAATFMVSTVVLCARLSSRSYKYKVKQPAQETEMMCISSLLPEVDYSYSRQRNPVANGVLVIHAGRDSDDDLDDNMTLSSFLPESERVFSSSHHTSAVMFQNVDE